MDIFASIVYHLSVLVANIPLDIPCRIRRWDGNTELNYFHILFEVKDFDYQNSGFR